MSGTGETPAERLARWTTSDLAIGIAAQGEQLRSQLVERRAEIDDLRARLTQLTTRVAQLEAENAELRSRASRVPLRSLAHRVYRKARSAAAARRSR